MIEMDFGDLVDSEDEELLMEHSIPKKSTTERKDTGIIRIPFPRVFMDEIVPLIAEETGFELEIGEDFDSLRMMKSMATLMVMVAGKELNLNHPMDSVKEWMETIPSFEAIFKSRKIQDLYPDSFGMVEFNSHDDELLGGADYSDMKF